MYLSSSAFHLLPSIKTLTCISLDNSCASRLSCLSVSKSRSIACILARRRSTSAFSLMCPARSLAVEPRADNDESPSMPRPCNGRHLQLKIEYIFNFAKRAMRNRWAQSWTATGGPLTSLQLLKSHDNERCSVQLQLSDQDTHSGSSANVSTHSSCQNFHEGSSRSSMQQSARQAMQHARLNKRGQKEKSSRAIPCTKGAKTMSTNSYTLLSSSRQSGFNNSFSSSSGLANRPGIEVQIDDHSDLSFALAADSCMNRVRLRRVKIALQRWRNHATSSLPAKPTGRARPKLCQHSRLKVRGISLSCADEPDHLPESEGFERELELQGAAKIVSVAICNGNRHAYGNLTARPDP